jgi:hypothetical protein
MERLMFAMNVERFELISIGVLEDPDPIQRSQARMQRRYMR